MADKIIPSPLTINKSHLSFILPLCYSSKKKAEFAKTLKRKGFTLFQLEDKSKDDNIYEKSKNTRDFSRGMNWLELE